MKRTGRVWMRVGGGQVPWPRPTNREQELGELPPQLALHSGSKEREVSGEPGTVVIAKGSV